MSGNETEAWPELSQRTSQQILTSAPVAAESAGGFDPYKSMLIKRQQDDGSKPIDTSDTIKWPEADIKKLQDFCAQYVIVGFNCGRMSPLAALSMLKAKLGVVDGIPSESAAYSAKNRYGDKFLLKG